MMMMMMANMSTMNLATAILMRGKLVFHLLYDVSQNKFITQKKIIELSKRRIIKEF